MSSPRRCEQCGRAMSPRQHRQSHPTSGNKVCSSCMKLQHQPEWAMTYNATNLPKPFLAEFHRRQAEALASIAKVAAMDKVAHDSGDGMDLAHCFSGDTRYLTRDGIRTLAETVGTVQQVLTSTDSTNPHSGVWVDAIVHDFGVQPLWAVTMKRNRQIKVVRVTADHRWLVTAGHTRDQHRVVRTVDLKAGNRLAHLRPPVSWAEPDHEAIRMGFLFGDGHIQTQSGRTYGRVSLWGGKRDLAKFYEEISSSPGHELTTPNGIKGLHYSSGMAGYTKTLPPLNLPTGYLRGWLMGYLAADGEVSGINGQISLSCSSIETLMYVRDVATVLGLGTFAPRTRMKKGYGEQESALHKIGFSALDFDSTFFLRDDQRAAFEVGSHHHERFGWSIVSVEDTGQSETVYCPRVPGTESFVLEDNVWTMNCPFCGSGGIIGGSDGTVECQFCHKFFTVQAQPEFKAMPQTIDGQPYNIPGMPGGGPDAGAAQDQRGQDAEDAQLDGDPIPDQQRDPNGDDGATGGPPKGDNPFAKKDGPAKKKEPNPFAKGSLLITAEGIALQPGAYLQHLALIYADDRDSVLNQVRKENQS